MAGRRRRKSDDGVEGCLFTFLFEIPFYLLINVMASNDQTAKWIAAGILVGVMLCLSLASAGVPFTLIVFVFVLLGAIIVVIANAVEELQNPSEPVKKKKAVPSSRERLPEIGMETADFENQLAAIRQQAAELQSPATKNQEISAEKSGNRAVPGQTHVSRAASRTEKALTVTKAAEEAELPDDGKYYTSIRAARNAHAVPSGYRRIVIESIRDTDVRECPGLIWKDEEKLYALPLRVDTDVKSWPLARVTFAVYEKMENIDTEFHYRDMNTAKIVREFEEEMPEYFLGSQGAWTGKFVLPVGLEVTNTSGRALAELLDVDFRVQDDVMRFPGHVKEIKEIYQNYVLRENKIIGYEEYVSERTRLLAAYRAREKDDTKYEEQMKAAKKLGLL